MPCPETSPCSETRQAQIALQHADPKLLLEALLGDKWQATPRTKGAGIFFTRLGITGTWEPGRDMRLEGTRLEKTKELQRIAYCYGFQAVAQAAKEYEWSIYDNGEEPKGIKFILGRAGTCHDDKITVFIGRDGSTFIECPPIGDDNLPYAEALLIRLAALFGSAPTVEQSQTYAYEEKYEYANS